MLRTLPVFALLLVFGCSPPPEEAERATARLVPAESLAALFPDSVGAYRPKGELVYRGYFADSTGDGFGVLTAARLYERGLAQLAVNLTSTDDLGGYLAVVTAGNGEAASDSLIASDSLYAAVTAAGWAMYVVPPGVLFARDGRAVEVKSLVSAEAIREALALIDLDALAALAAEPVEVDSTFVRAVE